MCVWRRAYSEVARRQKNIPCAPLLILVALFPQHSPQHSAPLPPSIHVYTTQKGDRKERRGEGSRARRGAWPSIGQGNISRFLHLPPPFQQLLPFFDPHTHKNLRTTSEYAHYVLVPKHLARQGEKNEGEQIFSTIASSRFRALSFVCSFFVGPHISDLAFVLPLATLSTLPMP